MPLSLMIQTHRWSLHDDASQELRLRARGHHVKAILLSDLKRAVGKKCHNPDVNKNNANAYKRVTLKKKIDVMHLI